MRVIEQLQEYLYQRGLLTFDEYTKLQSALFDRDVSGASAEGEQNDQEEDSDYQNQSEYDLWLDHWERSFRSERLGGGGGGSKGSRRRRESRKEMHALTELESAVTSVFKSCTEGTAALLWFAARFDPTATDWTSAEWRRAVHLLMQRSDQELLTASRAALAKEELTLPMLHELLSFEQLRQSLRYLPMRLRPLVRPLLLGGEIEPWKLHKIAQKTTLLAELAKLKQFQVRLRAIIRDAFAQHWLASPDQLPESLAECQALGLFIAQGCSLHIPGIWQESTCRKVDAGVDSYCDTWVVCAPRVLTFDDPEWQDQLYQPLKWVAELVPDQLGDRLREWQHEGGVRLRREELQPAWHPLAERLAGICDWLCDPLTIAANEATTGKMTVEGCQYLLDQNSQQIDRMLRSTFHPINFDQLFRSVLGSPYITTRLCILLLNHSNLVIRVGAVNRLRDISAPAIPALITDLGDTSDNVRRLAAEALAKIGSQAIPALVTAVDNSNDNVADRSAEAPDEIRSSVAVQAVPALNNALSDTRCTLGNTHASAVLDLIEALRDTNLDVRLHATEVLGKIGSPTAEPAIPHLIRAFGDTNDNVRCGAAEALSKIGSPAVPALITALGDWDYDLRRYAARALGKIGSPATDSAVPALISSLGDSHDIVRLQAAMALGMIGSPAADSAVQVLISALRDFNDTLRRGHAAEALGEIGSPAANRAVRDLIKALGDRVAWVRRYSALALGKIGSPAANRSVPALIEALGDINHNVRRQAAETLGMIGFSAAAPAVPDLTNALGDTHDTVRSAAAEALGKIGSPAAVRAVPALQVSLSDRSEAVRRVAADSLKKIVP